MVHSQLEMLEEPDEEEQGRDVLEVDCGAPRPTC
jgi:gluconate kinase